MVLVFDSELEYGQGMLGVLGVLKKLQYLRLFIISRLFGFGGLWICARISIHVPGLTSFDPWTAERKLKIYESP